MRCILSITKKTSPHHVHYRGQHRSANSVAASLGKRQRCSLKESAASQRGSVNSVAASQFHSVTGPGQRLSVAASQRHPPHGASQRHSRNPCFAPLCPSTVNVANISVKTCQLSISWCYQNGHVIIFVSCFGIVRYMYIICHMKMIWLYIYIYVFYFYLYLFIYLFMYLDIYIFTIGYSDLYTIFLFVFYINDIFTFRMGERGVTGVCCPSISQNNINQSWECDDAGCSGCFEST
jgi:hypothetical protein